MLTSRALALVMVTAAAVFGSSTPGTADQAPAAQSQRLVAIGDLHADIDAARRAFRLAGATDAKDTWIGGNLIVVQMGDLVGRSKDDRAVLEFVLGLQARAKIAGGAIHALIGNHEVFAARLDHRWVDPEAFAAFASLPGLNLRQPRLAQLPAAERARGAAFLPDGVFAKPLATFPTVLRVGRTVFAHGGVLPMWARYGIDQINADVSAWLAGRGEEPRATLGLDDGSLDDGVMWSRHLAGASPGACALLGESLSILGADRMVVAHTVQRTITARCNERLWAVDVGMSRYYGGSLQVLEILGDERVRILEPRTSPAP